MSDLWGDGHGAADGRRRIPAGEPAVGRLRERILSSWQRCQALGLAPDQIRPPYQAELDPESPLLRAAAPVLDQVESELAGVRVAVVLADGRGVVLRCRAGEESLYRHLDAIRLAPGFTYAEHYVGTNGIGTALEERQDFQVFGAEHFLTLLHPFVSVGAPVRDPLSGRLAGVVGLVCRVADARRPLAAMARETAEAVEQRLLAELADRERILVRQALRGTGGEHEPAGIPDLHSTEFRALTQSDRLLLEQKAAELISEARTAAVRVPISDGRSVTLVCRRVEGAESTEGTGSAGGTDGRAGEGGVAVKAVLAPAGPAESRASASDEGRPTGPSAEWLLSVGDPGVGRLAVAARERLRLLYDAGIGVGTTLDVERTAEELTELAVPRFADFVTVDLLEHVLRAEEPVTSRAVMRRAAIGARETDHPFQKVGTTVSFASSAPQSRSFARGQAGFEPDLSAVSEWLVDDPVRVGQVLEYGVHSLITVPLSARGVALGLASFYRAGQSGPFDEDDLHLAEELVARVAMCLDNARRYRREHTVALTLQRNLLPRALPEQSAVEVAHRYLPAQADVGGVGGDWFDVIPLSGARVALVIGDVVGHGLHAAVTMGRLRTAVHNFAALDLSPDELLGRLDDLVISLDQGGARGPDEDEIVGATCLYAVHDPVLQLCTVARAGHPLPAVVRPDGAVDFPELPAGPPLGLGGLPFETAELHLPEGSQLVLYTDGLIEDADQDVDERLGRLRRALAHPDRPPEATCQAVMAALPTAGAADDVTLLVARTRALPEGSVASWEVPADPSAVSGVRAAALDQLSAWGLEDAAFVTELILSELVTNAIRHARGSIQVRLLRDRALICEVSDGSSTAPHLRRAADTDEGGRGLFLVAQLTVRWGTRYTARGKVIWTEQPLSPVSV